jgi:hypothetical protein
MEWPGHRHPEGSAWQRGLRMAVGVEREEENVFARREVRGAGGTSINVNDNGGALWRGGNASNVRLRGIEEDRRQANSRKQTDKRRPCRLRGRVKHLNAGDGETESEGTPESFTCIPGEEGAARMDKRGGMIPCKVGQGRYEFRWVIEFADGAVNRACRARRCHRGPQRRCTWPSVRSHEHVSAVPFETRARE